MSVEQLDIQTCESARLSRDARFDGKFFTAVLSTGIFCRPICPARPPKAENVRYYLSAEQALLAGYTPCKRCFPEQAATKNLPLKLKKIINNFDYKQDTLASIASKHQLSSRQLQRLFNQHFGISPSEYFQQQRLLLARKLLSTTELTISDICFASGFNSIRRFNEAIKHCYQCSPKALRKRHASPLNENTIEIILSYRPPFDWSLMLEFFHYRQIAGVEYVTDNSYQRSIAIDDCTGWLAIRHHVKKSALVMQVSLSDFSYLNNVIIRVRRMFDLDADINLIHKQLNTHPKLKQVIQRFPGLRLPGSWDIFEFSIRAILGQQISVKAATTYAERICQQYGKHFAHLPEATSLTFPDINSLVNTDFDHLGLTRSRRETLQRWVKYFQQNHELLTNYQSLEELEKQLCQLKGIGPWTINYIAMRGLSDPDAFPSADLGIIKALTEQDTTPKNKEILALSQQWRPWRAYAAIYLWHSLKPLNESQQQD
ncbi:AraC family transcriptional regulator [Thalassotalea insulae]|uniref:DNA-3-methyladenine glycosylase II n=1 Tax=Thalassotalea insulae TaxID=2056778 RepID=A0ABQ6GV08_9GAMM|nr:DNA-3-methyladenine glycosylase 2 [Thalassotalea insulae]GLX79514.1 AraC family transcriptional regulator [Thalassotalea insulae]